MLGTAVRGNVGGKAKKSLKSPRQNYESSGDATPMQTLVKYWNTDRAGRPPKVEYKYSTKRGRGRKRDWGGRGQNVRLQSYMALKQCYTSQSLGFYISVPPSRVIKGILNTDKIAKICK